jgi:hypothetical protein
MNQESEEKRSGRGSLPCEYVWERGESRAVANERRRVRERQICTRWQWRTCRGASNSDGGVTASARGREVCAAVNERTWGEPPCAADNTLGSL